MIERNKVDIADARELQIELHKQKKVALLWRTVALNLAIDLGMTDDDFDELVVIVMKKLGIGRSLDELLEGKNNDRKREDNRNLKANK